MTDNQPSYGTIKRRVRALSRDSPGPKDVGDFRAEADAVAHDRGAALILSADLERALEFAIIRRLRLREALRANMFENDGAPSSAFQAKILLADAIGLVGRPRRARTLTSSDGSATPSLSERLLEVRAGRHRRALRLHEDAHWRDHRRNALARAPAAARHVGCPLPFPERLRRGAVRLVVQEMAGPTPVDLNGLKDAVRASVGSVVSANAEVWAVRPPLP